MAMTAALIGGSVVAPIIGGLLGQAAASGDRASAAAASAQALKALQDAGYPPDLSRQIVMQQFQTAGILTPELQTAINAGPSALQSIQEDPALKSAQSSALQLLQQQGRTGMDISSQTAMDQNRNQVASDTNAKMQQIQQNYQQRGMGGAGSELAAQLQGAQSGANRESSSANQIAAGAQQNALNAIGQSGNLAGQMRSQDFNVANTKAQAADQMNRFNVTNQIQRQQQNVAAQNAAQAGNLNNAQSVSNANTNVNNQEKLRENTAQQTYWNSMLDRGKAIAGQNNTNANADIARANQTAGSYANIGAGVGQGFGAINGMLSKKAKAPGEEDAMSSFDGTSPVATDYSGLGDYTKG
jgi:hypothetical protein